MLTAEDCVIQFKGFTSPDKLTESDPINLVFYGGALQQFTWSTGRRRLPTSFTGGSKRKSWSRRGSRGRPESGGSIARTSATLAGIRGTGTTARRRTSSFFEWTALHEVPDFSALLITGSRGSSDRGLKDQVCLENVAAGIIWQGGRGGVEGRGRRGRTARPDRGRWSGPD